ncbi:MAG: hypothetical protein WCK09_20610 [Bacteroidota bacterium]
MLYGKSPWDSLSEADKESKIASTLAEAFTSAKNGTLPAGASIKDYWWSMFSPSMTPAGYNSFTNNDWIPNRIGDAERKYGLSFDYSLPITYVPEKKPGDSDPPVLAPSGPTAGPTSSSWQLYAGIGIILVTIGFVVYKKMND